MTEEISEQLGKLADRVWAVAKALPMDTWSGCERDELKAVATELHNLRARLESDRPQNPKVIRHGVTHEGWQLEQDCKACGAVFIVEEDDVTTVGDLREPDRYPHLVVRCPECSTRHTFIVSRHHHPARELGRRLQKKAEEKAEDGPDQTG